MNIDSAIESILFFQGEPVSVQTLSQILSVEEDEVEAGISVLTTRLLGRGIRLVRQGNTVELATAPEAAELIKTVRQRELTGSLGQAALETLTIILYRGPITRREIDFIRGVDSRSMLRNLLIRGLTKKQDDPGKSEVLYEPTTQLLRHLGVGEVSELPEYNSVNNELDDYFNNAGTEADPEKEKGETAIEPDA